MSAFCSANMRGPLVKMTLQLLLLMLCLNALTNTGNCQESEYEDTDVVTGTDKEEDAEETEADTTTTVLDVSLATSPAPPEEPYADTGDENENSGEDPIDEAFLTNATDSNLIESTYGPVDEGSLNPLIILIPVVLGVFIICALVCGIFLNRRWNQKAINEQSAKEDPYLDVDGTNTEKVPMPMFEEDVPSVLELEMDELDQWIKKDGGLHDSLTHS